EIKDIYCPPARVGGHFFIKHCVLGRFVRVRWMDMSNLKKAALWTALLALMLKVSGFIRESIVAKEFGASHETDAYFLAFGFITLIVAMISTGFNNVFLPMYVKSRTGNPEHSDRNANAL